jgi:hypothetical protein
MPIVLNQGALEAQIMAAALAFIIALLLPASYGPIEFKAIGVSFKGASGPIVLWLICFLGIVAAVRLTW